jgi:iron complex outermembrane receptor protein
MVNSVPVPLARDDEERLMKYLTLALTVALVVPSVSFAQDMVLTGTVTTRDDGLSLPGAVVSIESLKLSATTAEDGRFTLTLPAGTSTTAALEVRVTSSGLLPRTWSFKPAAGTVTHDFALALTFSEEITVGSRAIGVEAEGALPVDIITARQIEMTGASETMQVIQRLAPSFNFPRTTIADGSASVRPASLRGMGPDQVLVLINGKRRHTTALVHVNGTMGRGSTGADLNAIPVTAIERIEILRDGAAAQYGSDAIAGVINIVLKSGPSGATVSLRGGTTITDQGVGGDSTRDGRLFDGGLNKGFKLGKGWANITAEYRDRGKTNRAGPDPRDQIVAGDAGRNAVAQPSHWVGDPETTDVLTFINAQVPVGETNFFYAFGGYSKRDAVAPGFYRRALQFTQNWPQIYPIGFLPLIETAIDDSSGTIGMRGTRNDWYWDASLQGGRNSMDFNITNTLNASLGPTSKTEFYAGTFVGDQVLLNVDLSREFDAGLAGPLNVAFGTEFRREGYQIQAGEPDSYRDGGVRASNGAVAVPGAQVFPGFRPSNAVDKSRNNVALYADLEGDVATKVRMGAAGRFERYSDFGSTFDGKVTVRIQASDTFVLRGAASTGFRAPSLAQSNFSAVSTNFINLPGQGTVPVEVGTFAVASPVARALGATDLKPEDTLHFTGGFAFTPSKGFDFTTDYYNVKIDDRIVFSGNFTGGAITALLAPLGATGARFFTNAINTRTSGVDVTANYRTSMSSGSTFRFFAGYNYNKTKIQGEVATPPQLTGLGNVLFDRVERGRIECGQPHHQARFIGDFTKGRFSGSANLGLYGSFCVKQLNATGADDQAFSKKWVTDLEASYRLEKVTLGVGVQNLFDVYPEQVLAQLNAQGVRYPTTNTFGINGRFVYARASLRF